MAPQSAELRTGPLQSRRNVHQGPTLLCYDGSDEAAAAIAAAARIVSERDAVVVSVWEPLAVWQPFDPGALLSAGVAKLGSDKLGLDEIAKELGEETVQKGVERARAAGFDARGQSVSGKPWRAICDLATELDARLIVLGARGLSRMQSALLGSVSGAVVVHARRPVLVIPRQEPDEPEESADA
jgi:nucleotide-binding universal stress UspA family protein